VADQIARSGMIVHPGYITGRVAPAAIAEHQPGPSSALDGW
jgi:hypothetical protein